jgi:hypothetical protein
MERLVATNGAGIMHDIRGADGRNAILPLPLREGVGGEGTAITVRARRGGGSTTTRADRGGAPPLPACSVHFPPTALRLLRTAHMPATSWKVRAKTPACERLMRHTLRRRQGVRAAAPTPGGRACSRPAEPQSKFGQEFRGHNRSERSCRLNAPLAQLVQDTAMLPGERHCQTHRIGTAPFCAWHAGSQLSPGMSEGLNVCADFSRGTPRLSGICRLL